MSRIGLTFAFAAALAFLGCTSASTSNATPDDASPDATLDLADALDSADAPADISKSAACVDAFGDALPAGYGRLDGTVVAVVAPGEQCPLPNSTHVIVEVEAGGAVYRVVVNVLSTSGDPNVRFGELSHPLLAPVFGEGFHPSVTLDYAQDLGLHSNAAPFSPYAMKDLVARVIGELDVGARVAVYAQGSGGTSVHDVHRWGGNADGAIVLDPAGAAPKWLVFHFADQTF